LRDAGWDIDIIAHHRRGGWVLGLCGGYQMLGRVVDDPLGLEGAPGASEGLALLDVETVLAPLKTVRQSRATDLTTGCAVSGYEIHQGETTGPDTARPMLQLQDRPDGAIAGNGRVMGAYLHGLFTSDAFRHAFLARIRSRTPSDLAYEARINAVLDGLAEHLASHLDTGAVARIAGLD
jgi:adenosylcobyric acid synthase